MRHQILYLLASIITIPFLPLLWWQGRSIKANMPDLPEAKGENGIEGHHIPEVHILSLGESTMAGVGVEYHEEGLSGQVAKALHRLTGQSVRWQVIAKSGFTAGKVKKMLVPKIAVKKLDLILIGLGANDAFSLNSPLRWKRDMRDLIRRIREKEIHCPIVIANMPPVNDFPIFPKSFHLILGNLIGLYGKTMQELSQQMNNVHFMDEVISFERFLQKSPDKKDKNDFFSDGVHPSALTYSIWSEEIAEFIFQRKLVG
ncbi:MAG: SGNH/GDSL hydrolase family protein [Bacteroidota bacterium]